jgi:opacity protein-like surface antigen
MQKLLSVLIGAVAAITSLPAAAQMRSDPAATNWYLGGSVGRAKAKDFCGRIGGAATACDDTDVAWGFYGGYQFNRNLAGEIGYRWLGHAETTGPSARMATELWEVDAVGILPLGGISLYGKLGLFRAYAKGADAFAGINEHTSTATFAGGLQFDVDRRFAVRGEWQRYPKVGGGNYGGSTAVDVWSVGGQYRF